MSAPNKSQIGDMGKDGGRRDERVVGNQETQAKIAP
jgi:hypothetical protein